MSRTCEGCGEEFEPWRKDQRRCKRTCKRTRTAASAHGARARKRADPNRVTEFIGVDGELCQRIKAYALLSVANEAHHADGDKLTYRDIFPFLYSQYEKHPEAAFVGFFLAFDFAQILAGVPSRVARSMMTKQGIAKRMVGREAHMPPRAVRVGDWEIDMLPNGKRFKLRPYVKHPDYKIVHHKDGTESKRAIRPGWMTICDAGPFFQKSLLSVVDPDPANTHDPVITPEEFAILERGKNDRATAEFGPEMIEYNGLENIVLARVMTQMDTNFRRLGIKLKKTQWFGPGQAAQAWLRSQEAPTTEDIIATVPEWARTAGKSAYYGGWFEIFAHGLIPGPSYEYDINSAYPYAMSKLPCLLHGKWTHKGMEERKGPQGRDIVEMSTPPKLKPNGFRIVHAFVYSKAGVPMGAVPYRTWSGAIMRPEKSSGWYFWHELEAAKRAGLVRKITVTDWVQYDPCDCSPPLAAEATLYNDRLRIGKKTAEGMALRIVMNSPYGKTAQSKGSPKYANAIYASLITASCRTQILDAIATHPDGPSSVLMVATDSVTFKTPHPALPLTKVLGEWDAKPHDNLFLFMPGLYWDDESRASVRRMLADPEADQVKIRSRGVAGADMARQIFRIEEAFEANRKKSGKFVWPAVDVLVKFTVISAKLAVARNDWKLCGKIITDKDRDRDGNLINLKTVSMNPTTKRVPDEAVFADGLLICPKYNHGLNQVGQDQYESEPYREEFGDMLSEAAMAQLDGYMTTDGTPFAQEIMEALHG